jgi:hypothetical protein
MIRATSALVLLTIFVASCGTQGPQKPTVQGDQQLIEGLVEKGGFLFRDAELHSLVNGNSIADDRMRLKFYPGKFGGGFREEVLDSNATLRGSWHVQGEFVVLNYWRNSAIGLENLYILRVKDGGYRCLRSGRDTKISSCVIR